MLFFILALYTYSTRDFEYLRLGFGFEKIGEMFYIIMRMDYRLEKNICSFGKKIVCTKIPWSEIETKIFMKSNAHISINKNLTPHPPFLLQRRISLYCAYNMTFLHHSIHSLLVTKFVTISGWCVCVVCGCKCSSTIYCTTIYFSH